MYTQAAALAEEHRIFDIPPGPEGKEKTMRLRLAISNALFVQTSFLFAQVRNLVCKSRALQLTVP